MDPTPSSQFLICAPPPLLGPLITAGAIILSAALATLAAKLGINHQREIARKRATLDLIIRAEEDDFQDLADKFSEISKSNNGLIHYARPPYELTPGDLKDMNKIDSYLNHYELISIGIEKGILDKKTYKKWIRSSFVDDWNIARDYIEQVRKIGPRSAKAYTEYEKLAVEWGGTPLQQELPME